jgi:hypothetical protein
MIRRMSDSAAYSMKHQIIILFLALTVLFSERGFSQVDADPDIALIYPQLTKEVLFKTDSTFSPTAPWELFFLSNHLNYEVLNDNSLSQINEGTRVVVIPAMQVVDDELIEEIQDLLDKGKGVLITGNFAQYNQDGNKLAKGSGQLIPGFSILRMKKDDEVSINHSLNGNTALADGFKPGQKVLLSRKPALYFADDLSQHCASFGSYFLSGTEMTGMVECSILNGKLLWFGFDFDQLIGNNRNRLLLNSIRWLSSFTAYLNEWPGNFSSAGLVYKNVKNYSDLFNSSGTSSKLNYFISPRVFEEYADSLKDWISPGDIGILWDDFSFSRMNYKEKLSWLNYVKSSIRSFNDQNYCGISANSEFYDSTTFNMLGETGYKYIFTSGYSESYSLNYDTAHNIYSFTQTYAPGSDYESSLKFIINSGGIFYINTDSIRENISNLIHNREYWLTTFSALMEWEMERANLELKTHYMDNNHYEIILKNNGSSAIEDAGIWILFPDMSKRMILENQGAEAKLTFDPVKGMYFMEVNSIGENQEITFRISASM